MVENSLPPPKDRGKVPSRVWDTCSVGGEAGDGKGRMQPLLLNVSGERAAVHLY